MFDLSDYIDGDDVKREKIALDIKYGTISDEEIDQFVSNSQVKKAFLGNRYDDKKPQREWNRDYLNILSYAAVAESFNEDYLRYLNEVSKYVRKQEANEKITKLLFVIVFIGVIIIIVFVLLRPGNQAGEDTNESPISEIAEISSLEPSADVLQ